MMQLGTRWTVGATPPRLPDAMRRAVALVEAELDGVDTGGWRWTLTWLEGTPRAELDDGTVVRYDRASDVASIVAADGDPES